MLKNLLEKLCLGIALVFFSQSVAAQLSVAHGKVVRHANVQSQYVDARNIDVWLPPNYSDTVDYPVIYMHDGQMLYDASTTWNKQEWGIDEVFGGAIVTGQLPACIVVGIWNNDEKRRVEYFPQRAVNYVSEEEKQSLLEQQSPASFPAVFDETLLADAYLHFIVGELKPLIDSVYSTNPVKSSTFIMGSSMGGLISLYAICEYPGVFGGAACLSTHWPAGEGIVLRYMAENLPSPATHRLYFDFGTATLDALYEPYQQEADKLMSANGYTKDANWVTLKFEGEDHSERAWQKRLHLPLSFLLKPDDKLIK